MPGKNALKISYSSGDVYFSQDEVISVKWIEEQTYQVHQRQASAPAIKYIETPVNGLQITFDLAYSTTETKLQTLLDAGEELTIYYQYQADPSAHLHCVPLIDGIEAIEIWGHPIANIEKSVTFLQSAV